MRLLLSSAALAVVLFTAGCSQADQVANDGSSIAGVTPSQQDGHISDPNFIVLIGDDMSVETLSCFGVGTPAVTPNLDRLCASGMRFDNFWTQPVCSPTRAAILSGRYGFRNGVGTPAVSKIPENTVPENPANATKQLRGGGPRPPQGLSAPAPGLRADVFTLPMALKTGGYETIALGKWHLADPDNGSMQHPNRAGFDYYKGPVSGGGIANYYAWPEVENGVATAGDSGWADSAKVDDALNFIESREAGADPFLLWMAFNAPHTPFHKPPVELLVTDASKNLDPDAVSVDNQHPYYYAMIEALDTEIGRLLNSVDPDVMANTYVIFVGDNGTPEQVATAPFDEFHAKGSLSQGGLSVPFIVGGPTIAPGSVTNALANSVDIYATLVDLAGLDMSAIKPVDKVYDTVSLLPVLSQGAESVRDFAYADVFGLVPKGIVSERAVRNASHKLIVETDGVEQFYRIEEDPFEANNIGQAQMTPNDKINYDALKAKLDVLAASEN